MTQYEDASPGQRKLLAILPKFTSLASFFASSFIIYDVLRVLRKDKSKFTTYHSILLGMSIVDSLSSLAYFMTTWPLIPSDWLPYTFGNEMTCAAQGFFVQLGVGTMIYNGFLSFYFVLIICRKWTDEKLQRRKIRPIVHGVSLGFALATATAGAFLDLYHDGEGYCWINNKTTLCIPEELDRGEIPDEFQNLPACDGNQDDLIDDDVLAQFVEVDLSVLFRWPFYYLPIFLVIILAEICMILVYCSYRKQTKASKQLASRIGCERSEAEKNRSRLFTTQALLYILSFNIPFFFIILAHFQAIFGGDLYFGTILASGVMVPSQGCFNLLLYLRPKMVQRRQRKNAERKRQRRLGKVARVPNVTMLSSKFGNENSVLESGHNEENPGNVPIDNVRVNGGDIQAEADGETIHPERLPGTHGTSKPSHDLKSSMAVACEAVQAHEKRVNPLMSSVVENINYTDNEEDARTRRNFSLSMDPMRESSEFIDPAVYVEQHGPYDFDDYCDEDRDIGESNGHNHAQTNIGDSSVESGSMAR